MKTPKVYIELVNRRVLTTEMIATVIYSLNKRAKNWRDKNPEQYGRAKKERNFALLKGGDLDSIVRKYKVLQYYRKKDFILLSLFEPTKIHLIDGVEYLYYEVYMSDFHLPGYIYELYGYETVGGLKTVEVKDFFTKGESVSGLVSVQFCDAVIDLINSNDFILIDGKVASTSVVNLNRKKRKK